MIKIYRSKTAKIISVMLVAMILITGIELPINNITVQAQKTIENDGQNPWEEISTEDVQEQKSTEEAPDKDSQYPAVEDAAEGTTQHQNQEENNKQIQPLQEEETVNEPEQSDNTEDQKKELPQVIEQAIEKANKYLIEKGIIPSKEEQSQKEQNEGLKTMGEILPYQLGNDYTLPLAGVPTGQVNLQNGNYTSTVTDISIPQGIGPEITVDRTYNSQDKTEGYFSYGWRFDMPEITKEGEDIIITDGSGTKLTYTYDSGTYIPPAGHYETLTCQYQGEYCLQYKDGSSLIIHPEYDVLVKIDQYGYYQFVYTWGNEIIIENPYTLEQITLTLDPDDQRITRAEDYTGRQWDYEYDENGDLVKVTSPNGGETTYTYDNDHNLLTITTPNENEKIGEKSSINITYQDGKLQTVTNTLDNQTQITYNQNETIIDTAPGEENHRREKYNYDSQGRIIKEIQENPQRPAEKKETTYTYGDSGNITLPTTITTQKTGEDPESQSYTYDTRGNTLTETDLTGNTTTYTYDTNDNLITQTDPYGEQTTYTYDEYHNMLTDGKITNIYERMHLMQTTDEEEVVTNYTYGEDGFPYRNTNALGDILMEAEYDELGNVIREESQGKITQYEYDTMGNNTTITETIDDITSITSYTYDKEGNIQTETTPEEVIYQYTYDSAGNVIKTQATDGEGTTTEQEVKYFPGGDVKTITDTEGNTTEYTYDPVTGEVEQITDEVENTTNYTYDGQNRITSASAQNTDIDGNTQSIENTYTYEEDRLKTITHNNTTYTFGYTDTGENTTIAVGEQNLITNTYNGNNLQSTTYANDLNPLINYIYDENDKITEKKYNDTVQYIYTYYTDGINGGKLKTVTDEIHNRVTTLTYDETGRLIQIADNQNNTIAYGYRDNQTIENITYSIGGTQREVYYEYDKDGRLIQVEWANGSQETTYDSIGRTEEKEIETSQGDYYLTDYTYQEGQGGSTTERISSIDNNGEITITYEYDEKGNIIFTEEDGEEIEYKYDELNQLIRENNETLGKTITYKYDSGGNILEKRQYPYTTQDILGTPEQTITYGYGDENWTDKMTTYNGEEITYDEIGNPLNYGTSTLIWRAGRQLKNYYDTRGTLIPEDDLYLAYTYNDSGIRTSKFANGITTSYYLEGDEVIRETDGTDTIWYTYDTEDNLISMNLNGTEYYYVRNAQNDIIGLIDEEAEEVVSYTYDSWGNIISIDGDFAETVGEKNPYRYRGYRYDEETGLYYLQSRYYNPEWGRFINADSEIYNGAELLAHNLFGYCGNDPINFIDNTGTARIPYIGMRYDRRQRIYYSNIYAPQRPFGYTDPYDRAAPYLGMNIKTIISYFRYGRKEWRIQFWKGRYGAFTGAEIGLYYRNQRRSYKPGRGWYRSASNSNMLKMSYSLYKYNTSSRNRLYKRYRTRHWWLNGFKYGTGVSKNSLIMKGYIEFKSSKMAKRFISGVRVRGYWSRSRSGRRVYFRWR